MAENEADERLGMAFPLIYRHFSPIFLPTAREFHATEPSREITTGSNFEAPPLRALRAFSNPAFSFTSSPWPPFVLGLRRALRMALY